MNPVRPTLWVLGATALLLGAGCATVQSGRGEVRPTGPSSLEKEWGIEVVGLRRAAADYMLDFRYRVVDPARAARLADRGVKPFAIEQASGARLIVPTPPKVGQLRAGGSLAAGKTYFIFFANPGRLVKRGDLVTVTLGELVLKDLTVQ